MPNGKTNGNNHNQASNLSRYETDVEGVSLNRLEAGLWWVRNRKKLKNLLIMVLVVASVIGWGYTFYNFGFYFFKGRFDDEKMVKDLIETKTPGDAYIKTHAPRDLSVSSVGLIEKGLKYDFYVSVRNPNAGHWGTFSYCFTAGNEEISCGKDFILPADRKYLMALSKEFKSRPSGVKFVVNSLEWKRIDPHKIANWSSFKSDHLDIDVKNINFVPADASKLSEKIDLSTLNFTVLNNSAYGYWEAPLVIVMTRSNKVVGINKYEIEELVSLDSRQVKMTWTGDLSGVNNIEIVPDVNILDENNYMQPDRE